MATKLAPQKPIKAAAPVKYFIPQTKKRDHADTYDAMVTAVGDQLKATVGQRRIFSISYVREKKLCYAEVGQMDQQEGRYTVMAILESNPYIVYTRAKNGEPGVMVLVSKDDVTDIQDFLE